MNQNYTPCLPHCVNHVSETYVSNYRCKIIKPIGNYHPYSNHNVLIFFLFFCFFLFCFVLGHESWSKGHTKGVLGFDAMSGFWLVHSVPKFPPFAKDSYGYPESGERYGQSFLCVTFKMSAFNDIGLQLLYNDPNIYDNYLPGSLASQVPNIKQAVDGRWLVLDDKMIIKSWTMLFFAFFLFCYEFVL